jgi:DASS family divalent anion:Na+ symporter
MIARGFIKTGLSGRIAYGFVALLGKKSLGLAYGLVATDLVLAPAIPSNTARAGGVVFPILLSLAKSYGSEPDDGTARKIGAFLTLAAFQGTVITSAMFLTAMAANPLAAEMALGLGVEVTWGDWALAAIVPGLVSLVVVPFAIYKLYPPEIKETPEAANLARSELSKMGRMKKGEAIMLGTFITLLVMWIFGPSIGLHPTMAAWVGLGILLLSGVLTWRDVCGETEAWNTLVWFAALVMMAGYLNELGFVPWFSETVSLLMSGTHWVTAFLGLCLIYFYSHYLFASNTAHVSSMYAPFLGIALGVGAPPLLAALTLGFFSNLFGGLTHYGTGPAPILFGSRYVDLGTWWRLGALVSVINVLIWLGLGGLWWKALGYW